MLVVCAIAVRNNPENTAGAFLAHLMMLQSFIVAPARSFDGASWSLSIEVACYLIFVLSCMAGRRVLLIVTALLIFWSIWRIATQGDPGGPWADDLLRRGLLGFFLGQAMWHGRRWLKFISSPVLILVMLVGFWFQIGQYSPLLPLSLMAWPAALLLSLRLPAMEHPAMIWLGDRSYAIYLINLPLAMMVASLVNPSALGNFEVVALQIGIFVAVLLLSDGSYRWLERPSRAAIRRAWEIAPRRTRLVGPVVG
jgi:peptidoglycan/LPS O-acetylase OafA/YrhL